MNNFKHWAIQKLLKWSHVLDVEKAVRDAYHKGIEATEKKYEGKINVWWDPTARSYPQPQKQVQPLHVSPGSFARAWHDEQQFSGKLPRISQVLPRIRLKPVDQGTKQPVIRTNTDPLDQDDSWLNSNPPIAVKDMKPEQIAEVPTIRDLTKEWDKDKTEERTAIDKLLYQGRQERQVRQAG